MQTLAGHMPFAGRSGRLKAREERDTKTRRDERTHTHPPLFTATAMVPCTGLRSHPPDLLPSIFRLFLEQKRKKPEKTQAYYLEIRIMARFY
mmetsp:Transcript_23784/g.48657  ORF Transcript_23784/g.48657 Transcript_23784/m.48657 type:complete len:92 (-) Transcript_23784:101-376(-)